ncbi:Protein csh3 [Malassezia sp. CBS 17886]|nr:Protein csh3 [Malassezia sp. CBS 17886]
MGFRTGVVIGSVLFIYGVLFVTSSYDYPLLFYGPLQESAVRRAEQFYVSMHSAPTSVTALLHAVFGLGVVGIAAKLHRWTDNDKYFGSGSIFLYMASLCMYLAVTLPNIRALARPADEYYVARAVFEADPWRADATSFQPLSFRERTSAVQVVAATNVIVMALLAGVLLLQGGEWYAIRVDRHEEACRREASVAKLDAQRAYGHNKGAWSVG